MTMTAKDIFNFLEKACDDYADCYGANTPEHQLAVAAINAAIYRELSGGKDSVLYDIANYWASIVSGTEPGEYDYNYIAESIAGEVGETVDDFFENFLK